jgi:hypothetical protein
LNLWNFKESLNTQCTESVIAAVPPSRTVLEWRCVCNGGNSRRLCRCKSVTFAAVPPSRTVLEWRCVCNGGNSRRLCRCKSVIIVS